MEQYAISGIRVSFLDQIAGSGMSMLAIMAVMAWKSGIIAWLKVAGRDITPGGLGLKPVIIPPLRTVLLLITVCHQEANNGQAGYPLPPDVP